MATETPEPLEKAAAFSTAAARSAGITETQLRSRRFHHVAHGGHANREPTEFIERCRTFACIMPDGSCFSDSTAAHLLHLPLPSRLELAAPLHITVCPLQPTTRRSEFVVHRRNLANDDVTVVAGFNVIAAERLFIDLAPTLKRDDLVAVGDAMLHSNLTSLESLGQRIATARHMAGRRRASVAFELLDGRAASRPETLLRLRFADAGIVLIPQCPVKDEDGVTLGHVDLGDPVRRIGVEYEGRHHASGDQFDYDIGRYTNFSAQDWRIFRAGRNDLADSRRLIGMLRQTLRR